MSMPEGTLAELIDGELLHTPAPGYGHQASILRLVVLLDAHVRDAQLGKVILSPMDVHLPSGDIVQPDLIFLASRNLGMLQSWVFGAPDLLIEVLSPHGVRRDRLVKSALYARNGVGEFWIVDPVTRTLELLRLDAAAYAPRVVFQSRDRIASPTLPGFTPLVAEFFE